jgi:hypothetical protein
MLPRGSIVAHYAERALLCHNKGGAYRFVQYEKPVPCVSASMGERMMAGRILY